MIKSILQCQVNDKLFKKLKAKIIVVRFKYGIWTLGKILH